MVKRKAAPKTPVKRKGQIEVDDIARDYLTEVSGFHAKLSEWY